MSTSNNSENKSVSYVLVPATIVESTEESKSKKNTRLPYGAKVVDGGYILNGTFYTDFSSDIGKKMLKTSILPKLEFIFSDRYLTVDTFLRPYMDLEGYFPVSLLLYIPAIQSFGVDSAFLIEVLGESSFADADPSRMTVRPKNDWKKWILPNPMGGLGVPRYSVIEEVVPVN